MSRKLAGEPHMPEKISFKYLTRTVEDLDVQIERRKGERYIVSPYRLAITNGNYYLVRFCGPVFLPVFVLITRILQLCSKKCE